MRTVGLEPGSPGFRTATLPNCAVPVSARLAALLLLGFLCGLLPQGLCATTACHLVRPFALGRPCALLPHSACAAAFCAMPVYHDASPLALVSPSPFLPRGAVPEAMSAHTTCPLVSPWLSWALYLLRCCPGLYTPSRQGCFGLPPVNHRPHWPFWPTSGPSFGVHRACSFWGKQVHGGLPALVDVW